MNDLIERLRSEAEISDRPGQYDRLNELADEFAATLEAARLGAGTSNARGEAEYEYEVWQGDALQAGGSTTDYASAQSEANHYAMMYAQDGPVEVRIYEKRLLNTTQQLAAVDEAAAIRAFEEHFQASSDDPYFEGEMELWLTAWSKALAAQPGGAE